MANNKEVTIVEVQWSFAVTDKQVRMQDLRKEVLIRSCVLNV